MFFPLVSVIIPVYNVENYLINCLNSVTNQTYENLEIILVDDGSTDSSSKICDDFAKNDSRVRTIHKKNGGLSDARNSGLKLATGEYITFIDSDDYFELNAIEKLVSALEANIKIVDFSVNIVNEDRNILGVHKLRNCIDSSNIYIKKMCNNEIGISVCGKLFERNLFEDLKFVVGRTNEDFHFLVSLLLLNNVYVHCIDYVGYNYLQRSGSITHNGLKLSVVDGIKNCFELFELSEKTGNDCIKQYIARMALHQSYVAIVINPYFHKGKKSIFYIEAIKSIRKYHRYIRKAKLNKKEKLVCQVLYFLPRIGSFVVHRLYIIKGHRV